MEYSTLSNTLTAVSPQQWTEADQTEMMSPTWMAVIVVSLCFVKTRFVTARETASWRSSPQNHTALVSQDTNATVSYFSRRTATKCSDRYYSNCHTRLPFLSLNVDFDLCQTVCQSYQRPGEEDSCDWFLFDEQSYNKCQMFSDIYGTMEDFFKTCVEVGGPTRHADGMCMVDASPDLCSTYCEQGCKGCDPESLPCENIHDVECTQGAGLPAATPKGVHSFDSCTMACAFLHHPFARWESNSLHPCTCWTTAERQCKKMAIRSSVTREEVFTCLNDNGDMGLVILMPFYFQTFPSRPCEIPPIRAESLAAISSDGNASTTRFPKNLISCDSSTCYSWHKGEASWRHFASFDPRPGHKVYTYRDQLLIIGGDWDNEYTSSTGMELPSNRIFNLGNPVLGFNSRASEASCLISNGDSFVLVGLRNQQFPGYDFVEEYSSTGEFLRSLSYFDSDLHRNFPACGTFLDEQGDTVLMTLSARSFEMKPYVSFILHNGASDWVTGPELPQRDYAGLIWALIGRNLGLGQLIITFSDPDHLTQQDVFQLTPDGKSWMSLGQFAGVDFDVAVADLSLLCD